MKTVIYIWLPACLLIFCLFKAIDTHAQNKPMKVICYNILRGMERDTTANKSMYVEWLKSHNPDIVAIQEAAKCKQKDLEELAHSYGHPYAILLKENNYCVAVTSKYPIVDVQKVTENMHHGFIQAKINGYNVIITHLSPFSYQKRRQEIDIILQSIHATEKQDNWIVLGDFNSISPLDAEIYKNGKYLDNVKNLAKKYAYHDNLIDKERLDFEVHQKMLDFGLSDAFRVYDKNLIIPRAARIDFIYVSKDLESRIKYSYYINDDFGKKYSDHLPLVLELGL